MANENTINDPRQIITQLYQPLVSDRHPEELLRWPVVTGADSVEATYKGWSVIFFKHTGNPFMTSSSGQGELPFRAVGVEDINAANIELVRENMLHHFRASLDDGLILIPPSGKVLLSELNALLSRHEVSLGIVKMKIFLSHKSPDKSFVRDFKYTLELLGFSAWLDEDAMTAGAQLDRSILKGMQDSCAAVFFITPRFSDESYLATEINYAIQEQRSRPNRFVIVTLVFEENGVWPDVPPLLRPFVWKQPATPLEAFREIVRAVPIKLGPLNWR